MKVRWFTWTLCPSREKAPLLTSIVRTSDQDTEPWNIGDRHSRRWYEIPTSLPLLPFLTVVTENYDMVLPT